jgi:hypothetical protein
LHSLRAELELLRPAVERYKEFTAQTDQHTADQQHYERCLLIHLHDRYQNARQLRIQRQQRCEELRAEHKQSTQEYASVLLQEQQVPKGCAAVCMQSEGGGYASGVCSIVGSLPCAGFRGVETCRTLIKHVQSRATSSSFRSCTPRGTFRECDVVWVSSWAGGLCTQSS